MARAPKSACSTDSATLGAELAADDVAAADPMSIRILARSLTLSPAVRISSSSSAASDVSASSCRSSAERNPRSARRLCVRDAVSGAIRAARSACQLRWSAGERHVSRQATQPNKPASRAGGGRIDMYHLISVHLLDRGVVAQLLQILHDGRGTAAGAFPTTAGFKL